MNEHFEDMAQTLAKRDAVKCLYTYLLSLPDHPNKVFWCSSVLKSYNCLDRRVKELTEKLYWGLAWTA